MNNSAMKTMHLKPLRVVVRIFCCLLLLSPPHLLRAQTTIASITSSGQTAATYSYTNTSSNTITIRITAVGGGGGNGYDNGVSIVILRKYRRFYAGSIYFSAWANNSCHCRRPGS